MVSKRQREARKKFKQAHPELFPKPQPTPPKDPTKKKKKKPNFKRKKPDTVDKSKTPSFRKKLLRVPGLKPGDSCYICKDVHHIAKDCPEKAQWEKNKVISALFSVNFLGILNYYWFLCYIVLCI